MNTSTPDQIASRFLERLEKAAGRDSILKKPADCWPYGFDNNRRESLPGAVVFARSHEQIRRVVSLCHEEGVPLVSRGAGTGTTGATVPLDLAVVLSFERMNRILEIDTDNRLVHVEPGVTNGDLQRALKAKGFFWPPDPTSADVCTIGGNLAYNSAGPRAVKYGTPRENTLALRAVDGRGETFRTGSLTTKGVVGYDLTRLLIGSEGTLAVITEAWLKITPLPDCLRTLQANYESIQSAAGAVARIMAQPTTPCALEFMDKSALQMVRNFSDLELDDHVEALLMIEVDGDEEAVEKGAAVLAETANVDGCLNISVATNEEERKKLWQTRKALSPALRNVAPKKINEDIAVPVSSLPRLIGKLEHLAERYRIKIINFGHAGNGNIHCNLLVNPDDPEEMQRAEACLSDVFTAVLELDGTLSGEHGVGLEKRDYVDSEIGAVALGLMHGIKQQFDPGNILNPGKTLPPLIE